MQHAQPTMAGGTGRENGGNGRCSGAPDRAVGTRRLRGARRQIAATSSRRSFPEVWMIGKRRMLLMAALGCALGACATAAPQEAQPGTPAAAAIPDTPAGSWDLVSIDGAKLPAVPVDRDRPAGAPPAPEIVSGRLVLAADGTFTQRLEIRFEREGAQQTMSRDFTGTWRREGAGYVLEWPGAGRTPATFEGGAFTYDNAGTLLRFQRVR